MKSAADIGTEESLTLSKANNALWEARLAMVQGDFETAVMKAEEYKTLTESFDNPGMMKNYHFTMGMIHMDQGNAAKAVEHLEKSDEYDVFSQYHLAKAYEMNGQDEEAKMIYKEWENYNFNNVGYALIRSEIQKKAS